MTLTTNLFTITGIYFTKVYLWILKINFIRLTYYLFTSRLVYNNCKIINHHNIYQEF